MHSKVILRAQINILVNLAFFWLNKLVKMLISRYFFGTGWSRSVPGLVPGLENLRDSVPGLEIVRDCNH